MMGKNESTPISKYEVVDVNKCADYFVEKWGYYYEEEALIECSSTEPLTLIEYINAISDTDLFFDWGYSVLEEEGAIAKNDDGIYEMIDSDKCVDVHVNEWDYFEDEAGGYCKKDAICYETELFYMSLYENDHLDDINYLLEEEIIRKKTNTIDYNYEIVDGKINPPRQFEGYEIDYDKCIDFHVDELSETLASAQNKCANKERTLIEEFNFTNEETFNNWTGYSGLIEAGAVVKNEAGIYEMADVDKCINWFVEKSYLESAAIRYCNGGVWIEKLTDELIDDIYYAAELVYSDVVREKWNDTSSIVSNTEGMNGIIEYNENGKSVYAIHNGKYCVRKTKDMTKSQITDYNGKSCAIDTISSYEDGSIVYFDVEKGKLCHDYHPDNSLSGYNGTSDTKTTNNQNSCLKFYIFNYVEGNNLNLILDHNTTTGSLWGKASSGNIATGPSGMLTQLDEDTSSWLGTETPANYTVKQENGGDYTIEYNPEGTLNDYKARLITADEIAKITGADQKQGLMFDERTASWENYFYFDSLTNTQKPTCKPGNTSECNFEWLYDNTEPVCAANYWTATSTNDCCDVWIVNNSGMLTSSGPGWDDQYDPGCGTGIRPVIEIIDPGQ